MIRVSYFVGAMLNPLNLLSDFQCLADQYSVAVAFTASAFESCSADILTSYSSVIERHHVIAGDFVTAKNCFRSVHHILLLISVHLISVW
jgi:hypothetical protein